MERIDPAPTIANDPISISQQIIDPAPMEQPGLSIVPKISHDFIPALGFTDDISIVYWVYTSIQEDIEKFEAWEKTIEI